MTQIQDPASDPPQNGVASTNVNEYVITPLYVGGLDTEVNDGQLYDLFQQIGQVISVRVCRDLATRRSLGYGYVNYCNRRDAARAIDELNSTPLNNKPIRVMYSFHNSIRKSSIRKNSVRKSSICKSATAYIFIKDLDKAIDHAALHETFSSFGHILSCKIATDASGQSKGYGFVQFDNKESAQNAIEKLNSMLINDKKSLKFETV